MTKTSFILFSLFLTGVSNVQAQATFEDRCSAHLQSLPIRVVATDYDARVDRSLSIAELTSVKRDVNKVPGVDYSKTHSLGLTVSESLFDVQYGVSKYSEGKRECFRPKLEIFLKLKPQIMYIASELKNNPCLFKEVSEHEQKHAQYNQRALDLLREELTPWLNQYVPDKIYYQNSTEWVSNVRSDVAVKILPYIKNKYQEISDKLNYSLDTPAEYSRLSTVCRK